MLEEIKRIYITGGTGFVGRSLLVDLLSQSTPEKIYIQTRDERNFQDLVDYLNTHVTNKTIEILQAILEAVESAKGINQNLDLLVNLAGEPIADKPWSPKQKQRLLDSRVSLTSELAQELSLQSIKIKLVLQCSATGFYGYTTRNDQPCKENAEVGSGFAAQLCEQWEGAAQEFQAITDEILYFRLGVVIGKSSGIVKKLSPVFKLGLGGPISTGKQPFPWIHIQDVVGGLLFLIDEYFSREKHSDEITKSTFAKKQRNIYNFVSPDMITQDQFAKAYAASLKRPAFLVTPAFILKIIYRQMAEELLLNGCYVSSKRLLNNGFVFTHPSINSSFD